MDKCIQIRDKVISEDELFIIAEVGNQFHGDLETSKKLVDVCIDAGADMIKFIFWFPDEIFTKQALKDVEVTYEVNTPAGHLSPLMPISDITCKTEPIGDTLNRLQMSYDDWNELRMYCLEKNFPIMSTINCPSGIDLERYINLDAIKIDSWAWNFPDLWRWCLEQGKPVFADCGPVNWGEIERNVTIAKLTHNDQFVLMHCFHTKEYGAFNMQTIPFLKWAFNCLVGYASADYNSDTDIMAVALGADVIEKRITLDRCGGELHDAVSLEPDEFKEYVTRMKGLKQAVGRYGVHPSADDLISRKKWFRRIVADTDIKKGETIKRDMLEAKRGETGISPERMWEFIGATATRNIEHDSDITDDCIRRQPGSAD
ncbi:hypothetical protein LCGC14_0773170 [marine sediment metagenome]|uniref:AFP-like domain-containing protein n=1 Tax=marine sediment metagenome TaxID=412755 RepID=A0A0F9Q1V5_9ZZZZ